MPNYNSRIKVIYLLIACLFFVFHFSHAQDWEKTITKIDEMIDVGEYRKASSQIENFIEKTVKKHGEQNKHKALGLIKDARNKIGLGLLKDVEAKVDSGIEMAQGSSDITPQELIAIYQESTDIMILFGNYLKAEKLLKLTEESYQKESLLDEIRKSELDVLNARILTGKGFYAKAIKQIDEKLPFYSQRVVSASGKKEIRNSKRDYAYMLLMKANSMRLMGNYRSSDSAFVFTTNWIKDNLSKADLLYSQSQFLNAKLLEENGLNEDALV